MSIQVEKGIPIPAGKGAPKYPFAALGVGDSFFVPGVTVQKFAGAITHARRQHADRAFVSRTVDGGTRVWRIK